MSRVAPESDAVRLLQLHEHAVALGAGERRRFGDVHQPRVDRILFLGDLHFLGRAPLGWIDAGKADQLLRITVGAVERTSADQCACRSAAPLLAVAGRTTTRGIDRSALLRCAAARRQTDAVRPDADIPGREVSLRDRLSESRRIGGVGQA